MYIYIYIFIKKDPAVVKLLLKFSFKNCKSRSSKACLHFQRKQIYIVI